MWSACARSPTIVASWFPGTVEHVAGRHSIGAESARVAVVTNFEDLGRDILLWRARNLSM